MMSNYVIFLKLRKKTLIKLKRIVFGVWVNY